MRTATEADRPRESGISGDDVLRVLGILEHSYRLGGPTARLRALEVRWIRRRVRKLMGSQV